MSSSDYDNTFTLVVFDTKKRAESFMDKCVEAGWPIDNLDIATHELNDTSGEKII